MAVVRHTLTGKLQDLIGSPLVDTWSVRRPIKVRAWLEANTDGEPIVELESGGSVQLGAHLLEVDDTTGAVSASAIATDSPDINWEGLLYRVVVLYPNTATRSRDRWESPWFELTADLELREVIETSFAPASATSLLLEEMQALLAAQVAISGIDVTDSAVATLIANDIVGPLTNAALAASFARLEGPLGSAADPQHQSVILFGTSQENVNGLSSETVNSTAAEWRPLGRGWAMWAHAFLDHQFYTTVNAGVSGERYDQMLARMSTDVLAYPSDWLWIGGAPNDVEQDRAAALVIADLDDMVAAGVADGRRVLVFTTAPTTSTTGARIGRLATINTHVRGLPATYPGRVVVADAFGAIDDGTSQPKANLTHDGTHYSDVGALLIGRLAAEAVRAVTPPPVAGSRSEVGRPSYTQILTNPFLTNSGWTVSSPATGSWDEPGAVSLTYSGAGADNDQGVSLSSPLTTGFAAGQKVRFRVHCEWRVGVPVGAKSNIGPQAYIWPRKADNSFDVSSFTHQTGSSETEIPNLLPTFGRCTIQTPWYEVGATVDRLYLYMYFSGISAGWVKFSQPEFLVKS